MKATPAGEFRGRFAFEKRDLRDDGYGNTETVWLFMFNRRAKFVPLKGGETVIAARLASRVPAVLTVRKDSATTSLDAGWRCVDRDTATIYELRAVTQPGDRPGELDLMIESGVSSGPATPRPAAPEIELPADFDTNQPILPVQGSAEAGALVTLVLSGPAAGEWLLAADADGLWERSLSLGADGEYALTARQQSAGGLSDWAAPVTVRLDTVPPAAPVITTPSPLITNNNMPPIAGTAEPLAAVQLHLDGAASGQPVAADETGNWSKTFGAIAAGSYEVTATARDAAGNISAPSAPLALTIDLTPPEAPVITVPTSPFVTTNREPEFEGTAEALAAVTIYLDGEAYTVTPADADGAWTFTFAELDIGTYEVTATATDQAGNESAPSAALALTVNQPLAIAGVPVTEAVQGEAYGFTVSVPEDRGVPPFTFRLAAESGPVPAGFALDTDTGEVSGPLTQPGIFTGIIIEVEDSE